MVAGSPNFRLLADEVVDDLLAASPARAYYAGDHRFDDRLPDHGDDAVRRQVELLRRRSNELAEIDASVLGPEEDVDRQLLESAVDAELFELTEVDERSWNPLVHNQGELFFGLLVRDSAPPAERLEALTGRMLALPDAVATACVLLADCPRVHVETAIGQVDGTVALIRGEVPVLLEREPRMAATVWPAREGALAALDRFRGHLEELLPKAEKDPRIGRRLFEARLWHALDTEVPAAQLLERAYAELDRVTEEITEAAQELIGKPDVRAALDLLAAEHPDDDTIVSKAARTLTETAEFVRRRFLVTVPDDPIEVIVMPEYARGVSVAYCDPPGPLEAAKLPTFYAISPTPRSWSAQRVESFYREYNDHMIADLTVHEAMPGHYLQLAHARRFRGSTRVRAVCQSGSFIEGWAVYAEELMARAGFGGLPVRVQQLKMQLRMILNAVLDQHVHCDGMTEADAMQLMTERGFQEEGEAAGKWRRALLTSAQLSTYFVGYTETAAIARARGGSTRPRDWHDAMLAHGSPSPRHLRRLLGL